MAQAHYQNTASPDTKHTIGIRPMASRASVQKVSPHMYDTVFSPHGII